MDRENESERRNGTESESDRSRSPLSDQGIVQP